MTSFYFMKHWKNTKYLRHQILLFNSLQIIYQTKLIYMQIRKFTKSWNKECLFIISNKYDKYFWETKCNIKIEYTIQKLSYTNTRFVISYLSRFFNFLKASSKMVLGEKWSDAGENSINFNTTVDWKMEMQ